MNKIDRPAARLVDETDVDDQIDGFGGEMQLALADIAEAAREGLLALSVTAGMIELDRTELCGPGTPKTQTASSYATAPRRRR
jgi:hypothetical protein